jgi:transposase InsO family protein
MEEEQQQQTEKKNLKPPRGFARRKKIRHPFDLKLRAVKLHLEEGFSYGLVSQEMGLSKNTLVSWVQTYRQLGEEGLKGDPRQRPGRRLPEPVRDKIIEIKKQDPTFGIKRISQLLRRWFFLQASPETVRHTLKSEGLMQSVPRQPRNVTRPRFFERATPNQMWQTDIFTFRLGGRYAYLIAFMDDYSRFLTGADLFRSPTAENVLEIFRVAAGEFQPPKEMLTDQGRQYTTWRGTSRFEAEMKKNGIHHFKSRPHHPMTLGKVERFWETIWQEFLSRAQFESFESARERIRLWVKYYNHKRPHQGIGGLCPADRYFEIAGEMRKTIEAGIQENLLEMALRGQPRAPFYMVGRMEGQAVILRAEKGKLKLSIEDKNKTQELVYDLDKQGTQTSQTHQPQTPAPADSAAHRDGEGPGGAGSLDRTLQTRRGLPPDEHQLDHLQPLAEPRDGRDAPSPGEPGQPEQGRSLESAPTGLAPASPPHPQHPETGQPSGANPACQPGDSGGKNGVDELSATTGGPDPSGPLRPIDGQGGGSADGRLASTVLPLGEAGAGGDVAGLVPAAQRTPEEPGLGSSKPGSPEPGAATGTTRATL